MVVTAPSDSDQKNMAEVHGKLTESRQENVDHRRIWNNLLVVLRQLTGDYTVEVDERDGMGIAD
jgi:hypothetical protein